MRSKVAICLSVAVVLAILAVGVACTKAADDSQLTNQIQSRLSEDSGLQGKPITVQTSGGVATLSGTVDTDAQRAAASRYAAAVPGIKQVINDLRVGPSTEAALQPAEQAAPEPTPEPERPAAKPRPSMPRHRPRPAPAEMRAEAEPPSRPMQDERPAQAQAPTSPAEAAPATPPPPKKVTVPSGTAIAIRLVDAINSETAQPGETFRATLDSPLATEGDVAIPSGYDVEGHVVDVKSAGKFAGKSELVLQLDRIKVRGRSYSIQTDQYQRAGSSRGVNTAKKVGAGAAIGAIIGGIAGGGKGAGIGAAAGGGLGGGVQAATKGQQINLPSEMLLTFTLQSPLTVTVVSEGPHSDRPKLEPPE